MQTQSNMGDRSVSPRDAPCIRQTKTPHDVQATPLRTTMAWIVICGCLVAGDAIQVRGAGKRKSTARAAKPRAFNVLKYGAVGDDRTDNTAAFSACLKEVIEAGGGRMYLPAGVYRGRIIVPPVPKNSWIAIEIVGERQPSTLFGTIGAFPLPDNGTIIKDLSTSGPAVISASPDPEAAYGNFSMLQVLIRDLEVRTYDDPGIGGIDLQYAQQCRVENVVINTGVYNVQASRPTHDTQGLITPHRDNGALTILRNVVVTGYHTGIVVNEHTDGDDIVVASNIDGLSFSQAHHASRFGRVAAYRCTNMVTVTGQHGFLIEQLNIEHAGPGQTDDHNAWQATVNDVNDPGNLGIADINYWVVIGNVGARDVFYRSGGASIQARRIGSAPP
jgi:Pectate lyase superfamily protein